MANSHTQVMRAFCKQILHQKASYAKLIDLWQSEQPLHLCETSGQLSTERSFDIRKMTWLKMWNIYNMNKNASNSKSGCTCLAFLDGVIGGVKKISANTVVTATPVVLTLVHWTVWQKLHQSYLLLHYLKRRGKTCYCRNSWHFCQSHFANVNMA